MQGQLIQQKVTEIRDFINIKWRHDRIFKNKELFYQINRITVNLNEEQVKVIEGDVEKSIVFDKFCKALK
jgi:hypothetical protein